MERQVNRGGKRKRGTALKPSEKTSQALLIAELIRHFGGRKKLAEKFKFEIDPQNFLNWRVRGKVPLVHVNFVATTLDISPYALNYHEVKKLNRNAPAWERIIKEISFLPVETKKRILSGKAP